MSTILLVDDESMVLDVLANLLEMNGHTVDKTHRSADAFALIDGARYDLYIFDLRMPQYSGADLAEHTLKTHPDATVLIITAYPGDELAVRAMKRGVTALVKKPFDIGKILHFLESKRPEVPVDETR